MLDGGETGPDMRCLDRGGHELLKRKTSRILESHAEDIATNAILNKLLVILFARDIPK
jgi:hypothetical protein